MIYYFYLRDGHKIYVPEVKKFMQWGTPTDLEEYEAWSRYMYTKLGREKSHTDIPSVREQFVKIPYKETTDNFKRSHDYWEEYFSKS